MGQTRMMALGFIFVVVAIQRTIGNGTDTMQWHKNEINNKRFQCSPRLWLIAGEVIEKKIC